MYFNMVVISRVTPNEVGNRFQLGGGVENRVVPNSNYVISDKLMLPDQKLLVKTQSLGVTRLEW